MRLPPPITSRTNARVKALRAALSGEARRPGDLLGLEGPNLIQEAHMAGMSFEQVFFREGTAASRMELWTGKLRALDWAVLSAEVFDGAVSTDSPQGIAATWVIQPVPPPEASCSVLVLEGMQDPGNLGTLIRSAAAFGFRRILVTPETANAWNPKVVRAAAGSLFRASVGRLPLAQIGAELRTRGLRLFAAVAGFKGGREHGAPAMAAPHGVLYGRTANEEAPVDRRLSGLPEHGEWAPYEAAFIEDADFVPPCAVLIGNEGAGLSGEALALAHEQVTIPTLGVESLNAAVAGSIFMYEVTRQIKLRAQAQRLGLRP